MKEIKPMTESQEMELADAASRSNINRLPAGLDGESNAEFSQRDGNELSGSMLQNNILTGRKAPVKGIGLSALN